MALCAWCPKYLFMLYLPEYLILDMELLSFHFCEQTGQIERRIENLGTTWSNPESTFWKAGIPRGAWEY